MRKWLAALFLVAFIAVVAVTLILREPPPPLALIKVVDPAGKPVAGAVIKPDGLRPKKNGGHYMWTERRFKVKPVPVTTDANGLARISYPHFVLERLETEEVSFAVDHPDFCPVRPFRTVNAAPPANAKAKDKLKYWFKRITRQVATKPAPVVLQPGAIVKLRGYLDAKDKPLKQVHAQIDDGWQGKEFWQETTDGARISRRISAGAHHVRLVYLPEKGRAHFSDVASFTLLAGQTNDFQLPVKPGLRLAGKLDEYVTRPVTNGRVVLEVFSDAGSAGTDPLNWMAWQPVGPDGSFVFESLPPGRVEIIALCDGFVSQNSPDDKRGNPRTPQLVQLDNEENMIALRMEPTATCEITVIDDKGQPLEGAAVAFWPNIIWNKRGTTIFAEYLHNTEDFYRTGLRPDWTRMWDSKERLFHAISDKQGIAVVRNLPAFRQSFNVSHPQYEMPINRTSGNNDRQAKVDLQPGETSKTTVTMQKLGTELLEHPK